MRSSNNKRKCVQPKISFTLSLCEQYKKSVISLEQEVPQPSVWPQLAVNYILR
jgi:hypothetical protein